MCERASQLILRSLLLVCVDIYSSPLLQHLLVEGNLSRTPHLVFNLLPSRQIWETLCWVWGPYAGRVLIVLAHIRLALNPRLQGDGLNSNTHFVDRSMVARYTRVV
jgi:hypothetical protein